MYFVLNERHGKVAAKFYLCRLVHVLTVVLSARNKYP